MSSRSPSTGTSSRSTSFDRLALDPSPDTILRPAELAPAGVWILGDGNTFEGFVVEDKAPDPPAHPHPHTLILVQGDRNIIRANRLIGRGNAGQPDEDIIVHGADVGKGRPARLPGGEISPRRTRSKRKAPLGPGPDPR